VVNLNENNQDKNIQVFYGTSYGTMSKTSSYQSAQFSPAAVQAPTALKKPPVEYVSDQLTSNNQLSEDSSSLVTSQSQTVFRGGESDAAPSTPLAPKEGHFLSQRNNSLQNLIH